MVPEMRIPGHITALYIFAVVNLMALFHVSLVDADVIVMDKWNITIEELPDLAARFGPFFPPDGLWGHVVYAHDTDGCNPGSLPPPPTPHYPPNTTHKWIVIIRRHGCDFDVKVINAQKASYSAALIHNVGSNDLIPMGGGKWAHNVTIPSAFIGQSDAYYIRDNFDRTLQYSILITNTAPDDPELFLLPFGVVVGVVFLVAIFFGIGKMVQVWRKKRRSRLSKEHLKKIPVRKFRKGDPYDVCAICLDDYTEGEKLRILPCAHAYHMKCIDPWLTKNKRTCPVCKRKVMPRVGGSSSSDSDSSDGDEEQAAAGENTPLLREGQAGTSRDPTFSNSGLPEAVRNVQQRVNDSSTTDSESDGEGATSSRAGRRYTRLHDSPAEVHVPTTSSRSGRGRSYGATATLKISNEVPRGGSINSAYADGGGDEADEGAVGGSTLPPPLPRERPARAAGKKRRSGRRGERRADRPVVLEEEGREESPEDRDEGGDAWLQGPDTDVHFVDHHYGKEMRGVVSEDADVVEETAQEVTSSEAASAGTSSGGAAGGSGESSGSGSNGKKKKDKKEEKLPKKPVKKKKRRRDEVA